MMTAGGFFNAFSQDFILFRECEGCCEEHVEVSFSAALYWFFLFLYSSSVWCVHLVEVEDSQFLHSDHVGRILRRDGPLAGKGFDPTAADEVLSALHSVRVLVM